MLSADIYTVAVPKELDLKRRDGCQDISDLSRTGKLLWSQGAPMDVEVKRKLQKEDRFLPWE